MTFHVVVSYEEDEPPIPEAPRCQSEFKKPHHLAIVSQCMFDPNHNGLHRDIDGHEWSDDNEFKEPTSWVKS